MSAVTVVVLVLLGVLLLSQGRKLAGSKQGRTLRAVAWVLLVLGLVLAIIDALDIVQDHAENDPAPVPIAEDRA